MGDHLAHVPDLIGQLADPATLGKRSRDDYLREAMEYVEWRGDASARDAALRRLKRRGVLRLACRDIAGSVGSDDLARELSYLAEGAVRAAVDSLLAENPPPLGARFAVIGMGKLGGEELT